MRGYSQNEEGSSNKKRKGRACVHLFAFYFLFSDCRDPTRGPSVTRSSSSFSRNTTPIGSGSHMNFILPRPPPVGRPTDRPYIDQHKYTFAFASPMHASHRSLPSASAARVSRSPPCLISFQPQPRKDVQYTEPRLKLNCAPLRIAPTPQKTKHPLLYLPSLPYSFRPKKHLTGT